MAINRKQLLRFTGAAAAGASLGVFVRGLFCPDPVALTDSPPIPSEGIPPAPPGSAPPPRRQIDGVESFAQSGEDLIVAYMIGHLNIGPRITYLDVGANDPVQFSNTFFFYKNGHRGVLVEPNPALCKLLRERRRWDTVVEAGIGGAAAKEADYYVMNHDGLNTFSKEDAEREAAISQGRVKIQEVIKLPLLDINDVMAEHFHGAPTFLSVDTEGMDLAILKSIDFDRFRPAIICAETLIFGTKKARSEIPEYMATRGYVVRGGSIVNTIFIDSKLL